MSSEAKVGLFVVIALSIFVATFLSVATIQLAGDKVPYTTRFRFAGGLEAGKVVRFGGLKAGVITDVRRAADDPTMAEVLIEVRREIPINEDSVASISSLNALGDNYMEISPGTKEAARIPPGGLIQSEEAVTFSDITKKVVEVTDTAQTMMADVKGDVELLIADLRELTGNLHRVDRRGEPESIKRLLDERQRDGRDAGAEDRPDHRRRSQSCSKRSTRPSPICARSPRPPTRRCRTSTAPSRRRASRSSATLAELEATLESKPARPSRRCRLLVADQSAPTSTPTIENFRANLGEPRAVQRRDSATTVVAAADQAQTGPAGAGSGELRRMRMR